MKTYASLFSSFSHLASPKDFQGSKKKRPQKNLSLKPPPTIDKHPVIESFREIQCFTKNGARFKCSLKLVVYTP